MTTTDRMSNLDSRREITDRTGQTVILGNSVGGAALSVIAEAVAGASGKSDVTSEMSASAMATLDMFNGSFGIWSSVLDVDTTASLIGAGASTVANRLTGAATGIFTWGADAVLVGIQVITSTQVYTPTSGTATIIFELVGGGGSGGGAQATAGGQFAAGGGGAAGGVCRHRMTSGFSGLTVTIGTGAAGVSGSNGSAGGNSTFGPCAANGGSGGVVGVAGGVSGGLGGIGGGASGGNISNTNGQAGFTGIGIASFPYLLSGMGGSNSLGAGGRFTGTSSNGEAGSVYGGGGSGASNTDSAGAKTGGAGANGVCIIYEYNG